MSIPTLGKVLTGALGRRGLTRVVKSELLDEIVNQHKVGGRTYGTLKEAVQAIKESTEVTETQMGKFESALNKSIKSSKAGKVKLAAVLYREIKSYDKARGESLVANLEAMATAGGAAGGVSAPDPSAGLIQLDPSHGARGNKALRQDEVALFDLLESRDVKKAEDGSIVARTSHLWGNNYESNGNSIFRMNFNPETVPGGKAGAGYKIAANNLIVEGAKVGVASQYPNNPEALFELLVKEDVIGMHNLATEADILKSTGANKNHNFYFKIEEDTDPNGPANTSAEGYIIQSAAGKEKTLLVSSKGVKLSDGSRVQLSSRKLAAECSPRVEDAAGNVLELQSDVYEITMLHKGKQKVVKVLHTPDWLDFKAVSATAITNVVAKREEVFGKQNLPKVLTHCRAGVGRTGTVVAAEQIIQNKTSVEQAVRGLRHSRTPAMVQSKDQSLSLLALARLHGTPLTGERGSAPDRAVPRKYRDRFEGRESLFFSLKEKGILGQYLNALAEIELADAMQTDLDGRIARAEEKLNRRRRGEEPRSGDESETDDDSDDDSDNYGNQYRRGDSPPPPPPQGPAPGPGGPGAGHGGPDTGDRRGADRRRDSDSDDDGDQGRGHPGQKVPVYEFNYDSNVPDKGIFMNDESTYFGGSDSDDGNDLRKDVLAAQRRRALEDMDSPPDSEPPPPPVPVPDLDEDEDIFMSLDEIRAAMHGPAAPAAPVPAPAAPGPVLLPRKVALVLPAPVQQPAAPAPAPASAEERRPLTPPTKPVVKPKPHADHRPVSWPPAQDRGAPSGVDMEAARAALRPVQGPAVVRPAATRPVPQAPLSGIRQALQAASAEDQVGADMPQWKRELLERRRRREEEEGKK